MRTTAGMVFAKNSDRPPAEAQVLIAHRTRDAGQTVETQYLRIPDRGAAQIIASHPTWLWGAEHGFNSWGVAIGNEKIWTVDDPHAQAAGLLGMDLVRLALERSRTADDALETITTALTEHGQGGSGEHGHDAPYFSSFLAVDARGGWAIETSARTWVARPIGDGSSISNRISMTTDWTKSSPDVVAGDNFDRWRAPAIPTAIADHRLTATGACVARHTAAATSTPDDAVIDAVATLRDHGSGPWGAPNRAIAAEREAADHPIPPASAEDGRNITVCMHVRGRQATTASIVVDLRRDAPTRAWACAGSPCTGIFVPFFPPDVPAALSDPAVWHRFARLRDRVEADPEALVAIRRRTAPVEAELWADAGAAHATGTRERLDAYEARATDQVLATLTDLGV
jgi:secernin